MSERPHVTDAQGGLIGVISHDDEVVVYSILGDRVRLLNDPPVRKDEALLDAIRLDAEEEGWIERRLSGDEWPEVPDRAERPGIPEIPIVDDPQLPDTIESDEGAHADSDDEGQGDTADDASPAL